MCIKNTNRNITPSKNITFTQIRLLLRTKRMNNFKETIKESVKFELIKWSANLSQTGKALRDGWKEFCFERGR